jgi:hypothetical protein
MGKLSASDIAVVAAQAGFTGPDLQVAVAVALAESSGNPAAVGDVNVPVAGAQSTGLWQINSHFHPEFAGQDLTDPQTNANAAYSVYTAAGSSFSPWSTYKNGAYSAYIVQAQEGVNA